MKVALVRGHDRRVINTRELPSVAGRMGIWPPLGLAYIGAALRGAGHEVELFDCLRGGWSHDDLSRQLGDWNPDVVGITTTTPEIQGTVEAGVVARSYARYVVVGGPHISLLPEETLAHACFDFAISGEGELAVVRLLEVLRKGGEFSSVPGLVWRQDGRVVSNPPAIAEDIDSLPFPDRSLIPPRRYERADARKPMATMISTRGCPFRCGFCHRPPEQRKVRFRSAEAVVDEMARLVGDWGVKEIIFCNDMLTIDAARMEELCRAVRKRRLRVRWQGASRVDLVDRSLMGLMKEAGCTQLKFGVESGSQEVLDRMRKGITLEQARAAFRDARAAGLKTGAYFILGYVEETPETLEATINFARELQPDYVMFYPGVPLPGTLFYRQAVEAGLIEPGYWRDYTLGVRSDRLPYLVPGLEKWLRKAFGSFYYRPAYWLKRAVDPVSWRAIFRKPALVANLVRPKVSSKG